MKWVVGLAELSDVWMRLEPVPQESREIPTSGQPGGLADASAYKRHHLLLVFERVENRFIGRQPAVGIGDVDLILDLRRVVDGGVRGHWFRWRRRLGAAGMIRRVAATFHGSKLTKRMAEGRVLARTCCQPPRRVR